jgi:hypothetical protein
VSDGTESRRWDGVCLLCGGEAISGWQRAMSLSVLMAGCARILLIPSAQARNCMHRSRSILCHSGADLRLSCSMLPITDCTEILIPSLKCRCAFGRAR